MKIETLSIDQKDEKAVLKTYILDDYPKYYQQQKRPAVVICPGGGYTTLARKEGEPVALKINGMGYHAFVLQYSVIFKEKPKSFEKEEEAGKRKAKWQSTWAFPGRPYRSGKTGYSKN